MCAKMDAESYLRSGSNELRVLEYRTTGMSFGINILKVSKIVSDLQQFTDVPGTHPAVKGVFRDMNRLVPVVDLAEFLGVTNDKTKREKVIVTEFFGTQTGFWVEQIDWIHHFRWEDVIDAERVFQVVILDAGTGGDAGGVRSATPAVARRSAGTILVARAGHIRPARARRTRDALRQAGARLLGAILTGTRGRAGTRSRAGEHSRSHGRSRSGGESRTRRTRQDQERPLSRV